MYIKKEIDTELIAELQQRIALFEDEVAYKKLFFQLFLPLKSFSFSFVKSKEIAEEIASDALVEVWARRKNLLVIQDLKMYLYVCVKNASLKNWQQVQKNSFFALDNLNVEFASIDLNGENKLISKELILAISLAIETLPPQCKIIFKLAKEDKMKYSQIAELLNISIKTIDNQIATAIKKISSILINSGTSAAFNLQPLFFKKNK